MSAAPHNTHGAGPVRTLAITGASIVAGGLAGVLLAGLLPAAYPTIAPGTTDPLVLASAAKPVAIAVWLVAPFALLLGSIAMMPFIAPKFWHAHFQDVAMGLGALVIGYYLTAMGKPGYDHGLSYGAYQVMHSGLEYLGFIALVGGLYVVSGGIRVQVRGQGAPLLNTALLAFGAVLANFVGTTGASMLLLRPFMQLNHGRLRPIHIVFFIFIVSNCGGCLTPIGDPPLYLGYLKGVPFFWTVQVLWMDWALVCAALLAVYFVIDQRIGPRHGEPKPEAPHTAPERFGVSISGTIGLIALALMIAGVFITPVLKKQFGLDLPWVGPLFQIAIAMACYGLTPRSVYQANHFTWFPVKEVGLLFIGIFATMIPALGYLSANGSKLGLDSPVAFYALTGSLSAVLDNAPTYLNFLQIALAGQEVAPSTITPWLATPEGALTLRAISTGAVFFGAMTYIGNGPNFMVKAMAEAHGVKMPSFFGYLSIAAVALLPILVVHGLMIH